MDVNFLLIKIRMNALITCLLTEIKFKMKLLYAIRIELFLEQILCFY